MLGGLRDECRGPLRLPGRHHLPQRAVPSGRRRTSAATASSASAGGRVQASARPDPDRGRSLHLSARDRLVNRRCVKDEPPPVQCKLLPGQIRLENGRCVCPRGTSLIRGECRKVEVAVQAACPARSGTQDGRCVCPRGTRLIRGECRKDAPRQCKLLPGQIRLENGRCVCPRGTSLIRGACRKPQAECPKGTVLRNGRCIKVELERCPRGTVGTPPNCRKLDPADQPGPAAVAEAAQPSNNTRASKRLWITKDPAGSPAGSFVSVPRKAAGLSVRSRKRPARRRSTRRACRACPTATRCWRRLPSSKLPEPPCLADGFGRIARGHRNARRKSTPRNPHMKRTAEIMSRSAPASVPSSSVSRPSLR